MVQELLQAMILGVIQGITEWLPISSSGHLTIAEHVMKIESPLLFTVFLHFGSLIVILFVFWKDIINIKLEYLKKLIISSIPIMIVGLIFYNFIDRTFSNLLLVGAFLIINGIILFLNSNKQKKKTLTVKDSIFMGLAQAIAILPGISRSGTTITAGLYRGVNETEVIRFSFIMAIIPIAGATLLSIWKLESVPPIQPYLIGTIVSIIVGYFSLKLLMKVIKRLRYFGVYCILIGILLIFL